MFLMVGSRKLYPISNYLQNKTAYFYLSLAKLQLQSLKKIQLKFLDENFFFFKLTDLVESLFLFCLNACHCA